jgi:hypothetical protein
MQQEADGVEGFTTNDAFNKKLISIYSIYVQVVKHFLLDFTTRMKLGRVLSKLRQLAMV